MQRKWPAKEGTWSRNAVWSMPLPAMSSKGSPSPTVSWKVRNPLAFTNGIVGSRNEDAIAGTEYDPELRTRGRKRLIPVLLYADDGAAGRELDRMMNLRAEVCRTQQRALDAIETLAGRFVASQDAQPLGSYTELHDRVVDRCIGGDYEASLIACEFTQCGR